MASSTTTSGAGRGAGAGAAAGGSAAGSVRADARIPVTILTGFLGAGKTTTLKHVLRHAGEKRLAVIENEYGLEMGMDMAAVRASPAAKEGGRGAVDAAPVPAAPVPVAQVVEFRELAGGCVCCSIKGELVRALHATAESHAKSAFDHLIIETTGLADPHPIANVVLDATTGLTELFALHSVVTVVDAANFARALHDRKPSGAINEAQRQAVAADLIVINKRDLVGDSAAAKLRATLARINGAARILTTTHGKVSIADFLGDSRSLMPTDTAMSKFGTIMHHLHDASINTIGIKVDGVVEEAKLRALLDDWLEQPAVEETQSDHGDCDDHDHGSERSATATPGAPATGAGAPGVAGGGGAAATEAAYSVGTGAGAGAMMGAYGGGMMSMFGGAGGTPAPPTTMAVPREVLRAKGYFWVQPSAPGSSRQRWRLQGVRGSYVLEPTALGTSAVGNRLVLIGRGLDWKRLEDQVAACHVTTATGARPAAS